MLTKLVNLLEFILTKKMQSIKIQALRLDAGILVDDYELEILRSIEKIYPQLAEVVRKLY